jgi:hypothetical protein
MAKREKRKRMERTSLQLYRDCLRLANRVGGRSAKGTAIRAMVRAEFQKNRDERDPDVIAEKKASAMRALSNYLLHASAATDPRLAAAKEKTDQGKKTG